MKTAGVEPAASEGATLGLGPELAMATLRGLLRDAERLEDETLADAVTVYQNQFALVLAQQGGPLSELAAGAPSATGARNAQPQATSTKQPAKATEDNRTSSLRAMKLPPRQPNWQAAGGVTNNDGDHEPYRGSQR